MSQLVLVAVLLAVLAVIVWWSFGGRGPRAKRRASVPALWRSLRKLVHDPLVAQRLVDAERDRHPGMSEAAVLKKVIRRLERDRRR